MNRFKVLFQTTELADSGHKILISENNNISDRDAISYFANNKQKCDYTIKGITISDNCFSYEKETVQKETDRTSKNSLLIIKDNIKKLNQDEINILIEKSENFYNVKFPLFKEEANKDKEEANKYIDDSKLLLPLKIVSDFENELLESLPRLNEDLSEKQEDVNEHNNTNITTATLSYKQCLVITILAVAVSVFITIMAMLYFVKDKQLHADNTNVKETAQLRNCVTVNEGENKKIINNYEINSNMVNQEKESYYENELDENQKKFLMKFFNLNSDEINKDAVYKYKSFLQATTELLRNIYKEKDAINIYSNCYRFFYPDSRLFIVNMVNDIDFDIDIEQTQNNSRIFSKDDYRKANLIKNLMYGDRNTVVYKFLSKTSQNELSIGKNILDCKSIYDFIRVYNKSFGNTALKTLLNNEITFEKLKSKLFEDNQYWENSEYKDFLIERDLRPSEAKSKFIDEKLAKIINKKYSKPELEKRLNIVNENYIKFLETIERFK